MLGVPSFFRREIGQMTSIYESQATDWEPVKILKLMNYKLFGLVSRIPVQPGICPLEEQISKKNHKFQTYFVG